MQDISRDVIADLEDFLSVLIKGGFLLHGSGHPIDEGVLLPGWRKEVCMTDYAPWAIMKALVSNEGANISHSFEMRERFPVKVENGSVDNFRDKGYIFVIENTGFLRTYVNGEPTREYVSSTPVPALFRIAVEQKDYDTNKHPLSLERADGTVERIHF